jgi:hypothetical protein
MSGFVERGAIIGDDHCLRRMPAIGDHHENVAGDEQVGCQGSVFVEIPA